MNKHTNRTNVTKPLARLVETKAETLKQGTDVHARDVVVAVQLNGRCRSARKKMTAADVLVLVRGLRAAGATNYVVVPEVLGGAR